MARLVAVLDADVLVPILTCDLLLTSFDHELYQPVVSPTILDEITRNLEKDFPSLNSRAVQRRVDQLRTALAAHTHSTPAETDTVAVVNAKDRHVATLALTAKADLVVTNDRRLRRELGQLEPSLVALAADDFAVLLLASHGTKMRQVVASLASKRRRPPVTVDELIDQLSRRVPAFAEQVRAGI